MSPAVTELYPAYLQAMKNIAKISAATIRALESGTLISPKIVQDLQVKKKRKRKKRSNNSKSKSRSCRRRCRRAAGRLWQVQHVKLPGVLRCCLQYLRRRPHGGEKWRLLCLRSMLRFNLHLTIHASRLHRLIISSACLVKPSSWKFARRF